MKGRRERDWSDRVLPWLMGAAIVVAIVVGLRSMGNAQTGELGRDVVPPPNPDLLAAPELEGQRRQVRECRDASGRAVYSGVDCASGAGVAEIETVPVELAPAR